MIYFMGSRRQRHTVSEKHRGQRGSYVQLSGCDVCVYCFRPGDDQDDDVSNSERRASADSDYVPEKRV